MKRTTRWMAGSLLALVLATTAAARDVVYRGICEASAAAMLDARHFVVGDDGHNLLSIYEVDRPERVATLDLVAYLDTETGADGQPKKSDLEAAARVGMRIYWLGSHSRDRKHHREESRLRFFATPLRTSQGRTLVDPPTRPPYRALLDDLVADPRMKAIAAAAAKKVGPEEAGGLNIEGLAATPEGRLLIGFRNPRPEGKALIVPFENPDAVVAGTAKKARFGDPVLLDLGQRGIRSIDWIGDRYLIVAGPSGARAGDGPGSDFALYAWSGVPTERPKRWVNVDLGALGPEALVRIPSTDSVLLLSDDGDQCKAQGIVGDAMSFRSTTLDLSTAVLD